MYYIIRYILFALFPLLFACKTNYKYINQQFEPQTKGKYELKMELAKGEYYEYEPVLAKFTLVNHDSIPLKITNHFLPYSTLNTCLVFLGYDTPKENSKPNSYRWSKYGVRMSHATGEVDTIIVAPKDTFYTSMPINNWGFSETDSRKKYLFRNFGYFNEGLYRFYYCYVQNHTKIKYSDHILESNEQFLRIEKNAPEDEILLQELIDKRPKYDSLQIAKLPGVYREYMLKEGIGSSPERIVSEYERFIGEFPNSYYLLDDHFIKYYIHFLIQDCSTIDEAYNVLYQKIKNELVLQYISNRSRIKNMLSKKLY